MWHLKSDQIQSYWKQYILTLHFFFLQNWAYSQWIIFQEFSCFLLLAGKTTNKRNFLDIIWQTFSATFFVFKYLQTYGAITNI